MENLKNLINHAHGKDYKELVVYLGEKLIMDLELFNEFSPKLNDEKIKELSEQEQTFIHEMLYKISIMIYYTELKYLGIYIIDYLYLNKKYENINSLRRNIEYYVEQLKYRDYITLEHEAPLLDNPCKEDKYYLSMNPSILQTEYGYLINIRYINYRQEAAKNWYYLEHEKKIKTRNFLVKFDHNFNIIESKEIIDNSWSSEYDKSFCNVLGMEDIILFEYNEEIMFTCNKKDIPPYNKCVQRLFKLVENDNNYYAEDCKTLKGLNGFKSHEKNWIYIERDELSFMYDPSTIIETEKDELTDVVLNTKMIKKTNNLHLENFRGSSKLIPFTFNNKDCYLSVIHEVTFRRNNKGRCYLHRYVLYDEDFNLINYSIPWYFDHKGVEFCRDMCWSHEEDEILITCGIEDREARIYIVSYESIINYFY